ncbi:MAG: hypothetical protein ACE5F7_01155 [Nitrospiria bacterium]
MRLTPREDDIEKNQLIAAILTNALFTAKLVHLQKGTSTDSKGIFEDVFATWTGISQHFHNEITAQRKKPKKGTADTDK